MASETHETRFAPRVPHVNYARLIMFVGVGVFVLALGWFYIQSLKEEVQVQTPAAPTQSYGTQIPMDDDFYPKCEDAGPNEKCVN